MPLRLPTPDIAASHDAHGFDRREAPREGHILRNARVAEPPRNFVSAQRVHQVLRARFGSRSTGQRGPGYVYWQTAEGVLFPLEDPLAVPGSKVIVRADGDEQLFYSYGYVVSLLRRVDEAERTARGKRATERPAAAARN